jgi:hypothetical protein
MCNAQSGVFLQIRHTTSEELHFCFLAAGCSEASTGPSSAKRPSQSSPKLAASKASLGLAAIKNVKQITRLENLELLSQNGYGADWDQTRLDLDVQVIIEIFTVVPAT